FVILWWKGLFEPGDSVFGKTFGEPVDGVYDVIAVAHPPPGVRVDHQIEIRADGFAHAADGFEILLGADAGAHLICLEAELRDRVRFFGVLFGRHVHAGAAVQANAVAHTAAEQLRYRHTFGFARQIIERYFDAAVKL